MPAGILGTIWIVDNASTDDSLVQLPHHPQVRIIQNNINRGFAAACNQGIAQSDTEFVVMLNPDALILPDTLAGCAAYMQLHPQVAVAGVRQTDESGATRPSCSRFPTAWRFLWDAIGLSRFMPSIFKPATVMTDWHHEESATVDQIMGSFMFIRRSALDQVGRFDEQFFVYYEELDLSKRLASAGYASHYLHHLQIVHGGGGTTESVQAFRLYLSLKSRLQYARKHFGKVQYALTLLITWGPELLSRLLYSLKQLPGGPAATAKAYYWLLRK